MSLRILFFGTPDHGAPFLKSLLENKKHRVVGVVVPTQKKITGIGPRAFLHRARRFVERRFPAQGTTQWMARRARLPIWDSDLARVPFAEFVTRLLPDLFVVASFNRILKPEILSLAPRGALNIHPSLLPKYRGADPVFWVVRNGEQRTGVTVHWMDAGVDTGPIVCQREVEIPEGADSTSLIETLTRAGTEVLAEALDQVEVGRASRKVQEEREASHFPPASEDVRMIQWKDCADSILHLVRASSIFGGASAILDGRKVKVLNGEVARRGAETEPGNLLTHAGQWVEVACLDAVLRLQLTGGAL